MLKIAAILVPLCAVCVDAQLPFPLGDAGVFGRVYDSLTQAPILRTSICREYSVPIYAGIAGLANAAPDDEARGALLGLLEFLEGARDQVHTFVKFVGD